MNENFLPYPPSPENHEISEFGTIRRLEYVVMRSNGAPQTIGAKTLRPHADKKGYLYHNIRINKKSVRVYVHQAVLLTFVGPRPQGALSLHGDGDNQNNHVSNLRYGTLSDNSLDAVKHGTHQMTRKTTCPMGHPYSEENTSQRKTRNCRDCIACKTTRNRLRSLYRAQATQKKALLKNADKLNTYITAVKGAQAA